MILLLCVAFATCVGGTYQDSSPQYTLYKIYILEEAPQKRYEKEPLISEKEVEECFTKHTNIIEKRLALEQKLAKEVTLGISWERSRNVESSDEEDNSCQHTSLQTSTPEKEFDPKGIKVHPGVHRQLGQIFGGIRS
ncbi:hypothetical protein AVEN_228458-1 [Araneus ventricosus]|uniref:Uncharacterized protein n=1 Tax=Araneus ventricosus TaxID=182803 RepID=A0A4Y2UIB1_ARAVE|nr:hypothetical protein AVEN_228458-1 [Araneus ventricosus]